MCVALSVYVCTVWYLDSEKSLLSSGNSDVKLSGNLKRQLKQNAMLCGCFTQTKKRYR